MKKFSIVLNRHEFCLYIKATVKMLVKALVRIPCAALIGICSLLSWGWKMVVAFCKNNTKAAVIIGFVLCFIVMFAEFVYFKLKLQASSYQTSQLIQRNYQLEQTDRYDIGYHDAMAKNREIFENANQ